MNTYPVVHINQLGFLNSGKLSLRVRRVVPIPVRYHFSYFHYSVFCHSIFIYGSICLLIRTSTYLFIYFTSLTFYPSSHLSPNFTSALVRSFCVTLFSVQRVLHFYFLCTHRFRRNDLQRCPLYHLVNCAASMFARTCIYLKVYHENARV